MLNSNGSDPFVALKDAYHGFFDPGFVASLDECDLSALRDYGQHVSVITPSGSLNPFTLQFNEKRPSYMMADQFVNMVRDAGLTLSGGSLVWKGQLPTAPPGADAEGFVRYVGDACLHYSGRVKHWTVVSEALDGGVSTAAWRRGLKECVWQQAFGGGEEGSYFIDVAFRTARGTAPDSKLYYGENVFDAEGRQGTPNYRKLQNLASLVSDINHKYRSEGYARDLIEGISLRGLFTTETAVGEVEAVLRHLAPLGLGIEIAPFQVKDEEDSKRVDDKYAELLCLFRQWSEHIDRLMFAELPPPESLRYKAFAHPERQLGHKEPTAPPPRRAAAKAYYGTPFIDGVIDSIWQKAEPMEINQYRQDWPSAHGTARVLWDEKHIYALIEVIDETQDCSGPLSYEHDSVEVYLSESGHYETYFTKGDALYRVDCENNRSVGLNARELSFTSAVNATSGGYTVEMRIPLKTRTLSSGALLGFTIQINDAEGSTRVGMATWHTQSGDAGDDPTLWGRLRLERGENRREERLERRVPLETTEPPSKIMTPPIILEDRAPEPSQEPEPNREPMPEPEYLPPVLPNETQPPEATEPTETTKAAESMLSIVPAEPSEPIPSEASEAPVIEETALLSTGDYPDLDENTSPVPGTSTQAPKPIAASDTAPPKEPKISLHDLLCMAINKPISGKSSCHGEPAAEDAAHRLTDSAQVSELVSIVEPPPATDPEPPAPAAPPNDMTPMMDGDTTAEITTDALRRRSASQILSTLSNVDGVEAAIESIKAIDKAILTDGFLETADASSPPHPTTYETNDKPPSADTTPIVHLPYMTPAEREQAERLQRRNFHLRIALGMAVVGVTGVTVWKLTHRRKKKGLSHQ